MSIENFIFTDYVQDISVCDRLIDFHTNNQDMVKPGCVSRDGQSKVVPDVKESLDCSINIEDILKNENNKYDILLDYFHNNLKPISDKYIEKFPYCNEFSPWGVIDDINIQYYKPGGGFKSWHTERNCAKGNNGTRHLVFMTYLNDVIDGGETEFYHQQVKIQPKKGLTVIWPADWTYTHRGVISPSQEKYIVTGWFNFLSDEEYNDLPKN